MRTRLFVAAIATVALVGCGKSEEQKAAETAAAAMQQAAKDAGAGAQTMAQGAAAMAQAMQGAQPTGPDGKPLPPVDFEKLIELLPNVPGWEKDKPKGQTMTMPFAVSSADVHYTKGDERVKLEITDAVIARAMLFPFMGFMGSGYSMRDSNGYTKSAPVNGFPGFERWNSENKNGEVTAVVANRYMVHAEGSDLSSIDVVRAIVSAIDLAKLSTLK